MFQRRCWKPSLARVTCHCTLQCKTTKLLEGLFFFQLQFPVKFRADATSQIYQWHRCRHIFSPSCSEFGIQAWSLFYQLQKDTTVKCWIHDHPRSLPRAEEQPYCCCWAVGCWTLVHLHRPLQSHKKGVQTPVTGLFSDTGPKTSISGGKVVDQKVCGISLSSSALNSFELALHQVKQIPAHFPASSEDWNQGQWLHII